MEEACSNKQRILEFIKSKKEPKLFFSAPAGVHLLSEQFGNLGFLKRIVYKIATGAPPINLGRGGVIVEKGRKVFRAEDPDTGQGVPVPFMDVLGMTETLTAHLDKYGVMNKIPHPLQEVFLLDPKTYKPINDYNVDGIIGILDPMAITWLELFIPGDIMRQVPSERYYGREFIYVRRLTEDEGWSLQRACGLVKIGTGESLIQFAHVKDVVQGFMLALEKDVAVNQTYIITEDKWYTYNQVYEILYELTGIKPPKISVPPLLAKILLAPLEAYDRLTGKGNLMHRTALVDSVTTDRAYSIQKARKELGYQSKYDLKTGLRETIQWYKQNNYIK
jgi:hypothetical protein